MPLDEQWRIDLLLGTETVVFGRVRLPDAGTIVGTGQRSGTRNYDDQYEWLPSFRQGVIKTNGVATQAEKELSRQTPDHDAGLLPKDANGFWGGSIVEFGDVAIATWAAVGGIGGIMAFLKLLKEMKSFWSTGRPIEVTLRDGTKIKVSSEKDVDAAIAAIQKLEGRLSVTEKEESKKQPEVPPHKDAVTTTETKTPDTPTV